MRRIKNVLINTSGNKLRVANIVFDETIENIEWKSDEFDWSEISTNEKRNRFAEKFGEKIIAENVFDGEFNLLIPGAIDPHVHFNTPGFEDREDFEHGTTAAAYGGVTTIIDMPCTSLPPVTNAENFRTKAEVLKNRSLIDYVFRGGVRGNDFNDKSQIEKQIKELAESGVAGFKVYVISGMETFTDLTYEQIESVAKIVKATGKPLCVHAEDKKLVTERKAVLQQNGKTDWRAYCEARDVKAEVTAVERIIEITSKTGAKIHIVHLSSGEALDKIAEANKNGVKITAETCPHYLYFTQADFEKEAIRNFLKTAPPVKFEQDKNRLWKGLQNNELIFVTTDHAGCIPEKEKSDENFWKVYGGIPGVEHRVPFLFSEGFLKGKITLEKTIDLLSTNVAEFYSLNRKGQIEIGKDADFALINLWESEIVRASNMHSKGKYTPFEGIKFNAIVETTFLHGKIVASRKLKSEVDFGHGKLIEVK